MSKADNDIETLRRYLQDKPNQLLLLELILATDVPVKQLLTLRVKDLQGLAVAAPLPLDATFGDKATDTMTTALQQVFLSYAAELEPEDFLLSSSRKKQALTVSQVSKRVRDWRVATGIAAQGVPALRRLWQANQQRENRKNSTADLTKADNEHSVQARVYHEIERAILSGKIAPGQRLITEELARMYNVSRIPVREAMGRLQARGMITTRPKWGSVVNQLSQGQLQEILDIRLDLESKAARQAVNYVDKSFIEQLKIAQADYAAARKTTETERLLACNRRFHFLIYEQANAPVLLELITQLWDKVSPYYHLLFRQSLAKSPTVGVNYHEKIVTCLQQQDSNGVEQWLQADLKSSAGSILQLFPLSPNFST